MAEGGGWPRRFEDWLRGAEQAVAIAERRGVKVARIAIQVADFCRWCEQFGFEMTADARAPASWLPARPFRVHRALLDLTGIDAEPLSRPVGGTGGNCAQRLNAIAESGPIQTAATRKRTVMMVLRPMDSSS
jgi:hypothetical protein